MPTIAGAARTSRRPIQRWKGRSRSWWSGAARTGFLLSSPSKAFHAFQPASSSGNSSFLRSCRGLESRMRLSPVRMRVGSSSSFRRCSPSSVLAMKRDPAPWPFDFCAKPANSSTRSRNLPRSGSSTVGTTGGTSRVSTRRANSPSSPARSRNCSSTLSARRPARSASTIVAWASAATLASTTPSSSAARLPVSTAWRNTAKVSATSSSASSTIS